MNNAKWYIVQVVSNHEQKVKEALEKRDFKDPEADGIEEIYLPYTTYQTKSGKTKKRSMFPGYLYVKVKMTDDSWYVIRNTEYVTGIVGSSGQRTKPTSIPEEQIEKIKRREAEALLTQENIKSITGSDKVITEVNFKIGDYIQISEGEFVGKKAKVTDISIIRQTMTIKFEMFGREQMVEIPLSYAKKTE